jgi:hypothetical protein
MSRGWFVTGKKGLSHHFVEGRSLCGLHSYYGDKLSQGHPRKPCQICQEKYVEIAHNDPTLKSVGVTEAPHADC